MYECMYVYCSCICSQHLQLCGHPIANDPYYGGDQYFLCGDQVRATAQDAVEKVRFIIFVCSQIIYSVCMYAIDEKRKGDPFDEVACVGCSQRNMVHSRTYIHKYIHTLYTYIHTYIHTYMYTYIHTYSIYLLLVN
jgi:hypothetical protein